MIEIIKLKELLEEKNIFYTLKEKDNQGITSYEIIIGMKNVAIAYMGIGRYGSTQNLIELEIIDTNFIKDFLKNTKKPNIYNVFGYLTAEEIFENIVNYI